MSSTLSRFFPGTLFLCLALGVFLAGCGGDATGTPTTAPKPTAFPTLVSDTPTNAPASVEPTIAPTEPPSQPAPTTEVQPTTAPEPTAAPAQPTAPPPTNPPPAAVAPENFFGASTNGELLYNDKLRAMAVVGGVQMVRTSVDWSNIEATKGTYNWKNADGTLKTLLDNNLAPLVLLLNNPSWAANSPCGPVNDLPAFDQYVRRLANRYPGVKYWVMYNEPDNGHFPDHVAGGCFGGQDINGNGKPDIQDYADQLAVAWQAIHETNPNAQLVMGALALDNFDEASAPQGYPGGGKGGVFNANFLPELLKYMQANPLPNGAKYFDVGSFNFYSIYGPYWQRQAEGVGVTAKTNAVRKMLSDAGMDAPLMVGETGEDSYTLGADKQAEMGVKVLVRGLASGLKHMVWWTFQDFADSSNPPSNTWKYGLVDQDGNAKPMYAAYQNASKQLTGAAYAGPLPVDGGEGYLFTRNGAGIGVVWSGSDNPVTVTFSAKALQVTDMFGGSQLVADGSERDTDSGAGRIGIQVNANPTYVQAVQ